MAMFYALLNSEYYIKQYSLLLFFRIRHKQFLKGRGGRPEKSQKGYDFI